MDAMGNVAPDRNVFILPLRQPTADDCAPLLEEQRERMLPQGIPWAGVRDLPLEVHYHIENLEDQTVRVLFQLTGGNEFSGNRINPGDADQVYDPIDPMSPFRPMDEEEPVPPALLGERPIVIGAREAVDLTFREDEIAEAALDLEAIVRYPSMPQESAPFKVLHARSDVSTTGLEMLPQGDVVPQIARLIFNLSSTGHVTASYVVRVRDLGGRLADTSTNFNASEGYRMRCRQP